MSEQHSNEEEEQQGFDKYLTDADEASEEVDYIQPDIELKLSKQKRHECREIVQEIKNFGATGQRQLLYLIYLLSLEVEDPKTMKAIADACKAGRKDLNDGKKLILDT